MTDPKIVHTYPGSTVRLGIDATGERYFFKDGVWQHLSWNPESKELAHLVAKVKNLTASIEDLRQEG